MIKLNNKTKFFRANLFVININYGNSMQVTKYLVSNNIVLLSKVVCVIMSQSSINSIMFLYYNSSNISGRLIYICFTFFFRTTDLNGWTLAPFAPRNRNVNNIINSTTIILVFWWWIKLLLNSFNYQKVGNYRQRKFYVKSSPTLSTETVILTLNLLY